MELITPFLYILLGGFAGGAVRDIVGYIKSWSQSATFSPRYFFGMTGLSGLPLFGVVVNPALALIIGYAGGDFLENVFRIFFLKRT
jgi:hypothetical protein